MNIKKIFTSLFLATLFLLSFFVKNAFAATHTLSGKVTDSSGNGIVSASINVINISNNSSAGNTSTDTLGNYSISIDDGTYNVQVSPPSGSNLGSATAPSYSVTSDTIINFILVPPSAVSLSGHVYGPQGNPLSNQSITLGSTSATTDSNGYYSLQTTPGTYSLLDINNFSGSGNNLATNAPQYYRLFLDNYTINESKVIDFTIPAKKVIVHVQDASNNALSNMDVAAGNPTIANAGGLNIGGGITNANGSSFYFSPNAKTDSSGNVTLWLVPTDQSHFYNLTVTPPSSSTYQAKTVSNITITQDTTLTVTLQQPVTLSGHIYGPLGNPLASQSVTLGSTSTTTDSNGSYSLNVSAGTYSLLDFNNFSGSGNSPSSNAPQYYRLFLNSYTINQDTTLDVTIPAKKLTVHVQDAAGAPIPNSEVDAGNSTIANSAGLSIGGNITNASGQSSYSSPNVKTDLSGNVVLWLVPTNQSFSYSVTALPPIGSTYQNKTVSNVTITNDSNLTITLQQPVTLSGHVYGPQGNPLPNQTVSFIDSSGNAVATSITDANGNYSLQASSGTYSKFQIDVSTGSGNSPTLNTPQYYTLYVTNYTIAQNGTLDITVPAKKVTVHVQNADGDPLNNVEIDAGNSTVATQAGLSIGGGITNATGKSSYSSPNIKTDSSGNVDLWLIPTDQNHFYSLNAIPPSGGIYANLTLNNVSVIADQNEVITLQFIHDRPATTASLSPAPNAQNQYANPTMVTLSATAASGFSIANTYYTVDGGIQTTYTHYTQPFTVTGDGNHTITFWSIDNSGVFESPNSKTFTILANQPPVIGQISNATLNEGGTYSVNGSFTDATSTSWTATVNYGDGSGVQPLALSGTNFSLSHTYNTVGTYTVTVTVTDNQNASGTATATVTVRKLLTSLAPAKVWIGLKNSDDVGIKFDLLAEVYNGSTLISSGELDGVSGGSSGFNNAHLQTITFNSFSPVDFPSGSTLSIKLSVRNTCSGNTHNSGTARLWYNDSAANSQFGATIGTNTSAYFLLSNFVLGTTVGVGPKQTIDVAAGSPCSAFKPFGMWSITP